MIYGSNEKGEAVFTLTREEHEQFKAGGEVSKTSGDASGMFTIVIRMTRPVEHEKRYPPAVFGPNYTPPEKTG